MSFLKFPSRKSSQPLPRDRSRLIRNAQPETPRSGQNRTFSYSANRLGTDFNTGREAVQTKKPLRRLPGRLQRLRRHFGWLVISIVIIGLLVYEMQLGTMPRVVSLVQASDAPFLQDSSVYARKASALFGSSAANRNKLTVDSSRIASELETQFPELQDVSVSLPLIGDQATLYIRPAEPALLLSANGSTIVIDENGRVVGEATAAMSFKGLQIPSVTDQSGLQAKVGQQILPRTAVTFISTVVSQLKSQKIKVLSLTLPTAASELDAYIEGQPYFVKFNMHDANTEAAALQTGTYIAVSKQLTREGTKPRQYIDVRLNGRAYYK